MDEMNLGPEAQELHDSIVAEIQSGVLKLKDGLPFGTGILRSAVISLITSAGHVKSAALPVPGVFRHGKAVAQSG
ncbi:hypothetical protein [Escherichia coli]|uniref:hypothetical protein n=1 Tax=Escherichia coli TaxID=562 RepID=UPI0010E2C6BA|nr:hypothetical protein [Escherichia coli]GCN34513.1 hypothetical protein BvCms1806_00353 [Escherichia coli]